MPIYPREDGSYDHEEVREGILGALEPGEPRSNIAVRRELGLDDDDAARNAYWAVRQELIDEGIVARVWGSVGGQVVRLVAEEEPIGEEDNEEVRDGAEEARREDHLYPGIERVLEGEWIKERGESRHFVKRTAMQGPRLLNSYSNAWTRPDFTVLVGTIWRALPLEPGLEVITFEVKRGFDRLGIFEALSHSRRAHQSYVLVVEPDPERVEPEFFKEAAEVGVGVIVSRDHEDFDEWDERVAPRHLEPNAHLLDDFLSRVFSADEISQVLGDG